MFVIQRRGREEKYVSGHQIVRDGLPRINWTTRLVNAQRFDSIEEAEKFVYMVLGEQAFRTLRCTKLSGLKDTK